MEEVKVALANIANVFTEINSLLNTHVHQVGTATYDMLYDSESVSKLASNILTASTYTNSELNMILGAQSSFSRHLSEVEQSVYEEIGAVRLADLQSLLTKKTDSYNIIYYYLKSNKS